MNEELLKICRENIEYLNKKITYNNYFINWRYGDKEIVAKNKRELKDNMKKLRLEKLDEEYYMSKVVLECSPSKKPWYQFWG